MATIGFIGLGRMGGAMAANLQRKGFSLAVHDLVAQRLEPVLALGAKRADGVAAIAAECDIVFTMLPASPDVEAVVLGEEGLVRQGRRGLLIVDMSTIDPRTTDRLAQQAAAAGMSFVDAPVGRLASHADAGKCLFMVGGSAAELDRIRPMLDAMGDTVHHCGAVGTGIRTKLINNFLAVVSCQLNAEALALAQAFGLSLDKTLEVIYGTTAVNGQLKIGWPVKVLAGDIEPGFAIDLAYKDLSLIVAAANDNKVPVPVGATAREAYSLARAAGYGRKDFSAMLDALCELARIDKPRLKKQ
ncbi:MAG TPA: NAD(P)-binding domain-containing protein [Burkholderiaceae bacterium]|nr:NAD(P)-binding domain-containing protein [Burkholderiaceae bacterium]